MLLPAAASFTDEFPSTALVMFRVKACGIFTEMDYYGLGLSLAGLKDWLLNVRHGPSLLDVAAPFSLELNFRFQCFDLVYIVSGNRNDPP
jgi:hypothetical protein